MRKLIGFVFLFAGIAASAVFAQVSTATPAPKAATKAPVEPPLTWHDVTQWGVEGRAFADMERQRWFDRLPGVAEGKVTNAVWGLSRDSTGMMVRFKT
ncbi:MAG TPA: SGNH/GDSL hydrolase N-terminal domain-containing protein, partial [Opitutaceae bacterium]|nr:SGNH/GDSL hydrolase N-terminal domain-containing protein [Opitutaceae bacterium]